MSASSPLVHPASPPEVRNVKNPVVRPARLTKALATTAVQPKPAKTRARIPALQRIRILQKSALGKSQRAIAREEKINRESVGRIVRSEEAQAFAAEMNAQFRGLCGLAMEALRQNLQAGGKEAIEIAWRVLETNGIIPPRGQVANHMVQDAPTEDESVEKTLSAFGRIAMERARVFNTPFPELREAAEQAGVKFDENEF